MYEKLLQGDVAEVNKFLNIVASNYFDNVCRNRKLLKLFANGNSKNLYLNIMKSAELVYLYKDIDEELSAILKYLIGVGVPVTVNEWVQIVNFMPEYGDMFDIDKSNVRLLNLNNTDTVRYALKYRQYLDSDVVEVCEYLYLDSNVYPTSIARFVELADKCSNVDRIVKFMWDNPGDGKEWCRLAMRVARDENFVDRVIRPEHVKYRYVGGNGLQHLFANRWCANYEKILRVLVKKGFDLLLPNNEGNTVVTILDLQPDTVVILPEVVDYLLQDLQNVVIIEPSDVKFAKVDDDNLPESVRVVLDRNVNCRIVARKIYFGQITKCYMAWWEW